jgi:hypothetical protein
VQQGLACGGLQVAKCQLVGHRRHCIQGGAGGRKLPGARR